MTNQVVRNIARPEPKVVDDLDDLGVATVHEAQGRTGLMKPYLRPTYLTAKLCGPAVTVLCHPGDNLMIHAAVEVCKPGDVLVVATTSDSTDGMFGELLATSLQSRGVAGLIIDAGVRDVVDLVAMQFAVWSKAICGQGTVKAVPGSVNIPIVCAGAAVQPGDIIVADFDGVVVVPGARAADVARLGRERTAKEAVTRERLRAGELGLDIYSLRLKLQELGVKYVDDPASAQ